MTMMIRYHTCRRNSCSISRACLLPWDNFYTEKNIYNDNVHGKANFFLKAFIHPIHHPPNCYVYIVITDTVWYYTYTWSNAIKIDEKVCSYVHCLNAKANILAISTLRKKGILPPSTIPLKISNKYFHNRHFVILNTIINDDRQSHIYVS